MSYYCALPWWKRLQVSTTCKAVFNGGLVFPVRDSHAKASGGREKTIRTLQNRNIKPGKTVLMSCGKAWQQSRN